MSRRTLLQGIAMGTAYGIAQLFLMFGIVHTSASVSGFLTGMYAVFTAVMVALILRRNPPPRVWISVGLATAALGVLTLAPGATGGLGLGAVSYTHLSGLVHQGTASTQLRCTSLTRQSRERQTKRCGVPCTGSQMIALS